MPPQRGKLCAAADTDIDGGRSVAIATGIMWLDSYVCLAAGSLI